MIVKQTVDADPAAVAKVANEVAALEHIAELRPGGPPLAPTLLDVDIGARLVAMSDVSEGPTLVELLLADDRERARQGLMAWAATLGAINGLSTHSVDDFRTRRHQLGPAFASPTFARLSEWTELLLDVFATTDADAGGVRREVQRIADQVQSPGPWTGLALRDACPGNERISPEGAILLDFETAQAQCVLLDAAHVTRPFPNCWCQARLPVDVHEEVVAVYIEHLTGTAGRDVDETLLEGCEALVAIRDAAQALHRARRSPERYDFAPTVAGPRERVGGAFEPPLYPAFA